MLFKKAAEVQQRCRVWHPFTAQVDPTEIAKRGHHRRIVLELSHFMSLLAIMPGSDLIATVPDDIATAVERHIPLRRIELPFKPPVIDVQQYWHRRMQNDPANTWLRGLFHAVNRRDGRAPLPADPTAYR